MENKQLLFSVTKNDLVRQTFCTGGPGGQHKNAKQNGVRLIHTPSGAIGEGRVHREQFKNEREALIALANSKEFKLWHKTECARRMGQPAQESPEDIMKRIDASIAKPENILIENYGVE